jgi:hypothetical protein
VTPTGGYQQFTETVVVPYQWKPQFVIQTFFYYNLPGCAQQLSSSADQAVTLSPMVCSYSPWSMPSFSCDTNLPAGVQILANNLEADSYGDGLSDLYYAQNVSGTSRTNASTLSDGITDGW